MHRATSVEELRDHDRLVYEWARAEHFWTPLSLIAVDASGLSDAWSKAEVGRWLIRTCRPVDVVCRTSAASFCVILPCTNRTGAEAELLRLLCEAEHALDGRAGKVGFGLAVAFDEANTALELKMLAERDARADSDRPDAYERPTVPHFGPETWIEPLEALTIPHLPR